MKDEPLSECPECGKAVRRMINGGSGIIFKGSGFYVTDNGGNKSKTPSSTPSTSKPASTTACEGCPKADSPSPSKEKAVG